MVDFSAIAAQAAGQSKKPPRLPPADFPGVVKSFEWGDANKNKTTYVRLMLGFTGFPDSVPETWEEFDNETQTTNTVSRADIDLSKRTMRKDFYMTEDSKWRLDDFLKSMNINCGTPDAPRSYAEALPELIGQAVLIEVQHQLNQQTNETFVQVGKLALLT